MRSLVNTAFTPRAIQRQRETVEKLVVDWDDYLHVLTDEVTPENEAQVRKAVRQCPRQAIIHVEE